MKDITPILNHYRECARHTWNCYFYRGEELSYYNDDLLDDFEKIDRHFFSALVLEKIGQLSYRDRFKLEPLPFLRIVPSLDSVPIMINRPSTDGNKYWDDPVNRVGSSEVVLQFIEYFDWNPYGYMDLRYFRVRIVSFSEHPHLVGRDALLETIYARVFFDQQGEQSF